MEFNGPTSKTLQKTNVYAISNSQCATEQSEAIISTDLCTYYPDEARDACQFDSGGTQFTTMILSVITICATLRSGCLV